MRQDAPQQRDGSGGRTRATRRLKYAVIGIYLALLALAPQWASLGFLNAPALDGEAELEGNEAERFQPVPWDVLGGFSYEFETPGALEDASPEALAERNERLIPSEVRNLDRRPIAVRGYVIPVSIERGRVTEFILAAKNEIGCCFGDGLAMNQWIHVAIPGGLSFDLEPFTIATALGVLEVGEEVRSGTVLSLYRMHDATVRSR